MFHVAETAGMEHDHNCNDLTMAHIRLSLGFVAQQSFFNGFVKFYAEFIDKIENIRNFVISKGHVLVVNVLKINTLI